LGFGHFSSLAHLTPDLSRQHNLHTFSQNLRGVDGKTFEEKLFVLTIGTKCLQIFSKIMSSRSADDTAKNLKCDPGVE
jgi:hypothetical protein